MRRSEPQRLSELVERLRTLAHHFGGEWTAKKSALLERCRAAALDDVPSLLPYHDALLFMIAYPETPSLLSRAESELQRMAAAARRVGEAKNARVRRRLSGTGIAWSEQSTAFSYDIAAWLAQAHPENAEIDYADESGQSLPSVLKLCLPPIEAELLEAEFADVNEFLDEAKGTSANSRLGWLMAQLERLPSAQVRARLFESLQLYVTVSPRDGSLSRTFARGLPASGFFHSEELLRDVGPAAMTDEPVPAARRLSSRDRVALLDAARGVLAMLGRETDPITTAEPDGVEYRELGRGAAIALYPMPPERRFPLDTHLGFVLFKNAVPVAYGGGWPFLERCKIGINVVAPFRGGESAYLFSQVLRVYRQRFGVERFVVEPYQFGADNREGLLSGAFWFYYRLGFRPAAPSQVALAATEFERIGSNKKYRSPLAVMRRLTRCDLELRLAGDEARPWPDPALLSLAATQCIGRAFAGDRAAAQAAALRRVRTVLGVGDDVAWPPGERYSFQVLSILVAMIADLERWSLREQRDCLALMRAKGARDETRYFELTRRHPRFRDALIDILERTALPETATKKRK